MLRGDQQGSLYVTATGDSTLYRCCIGRDVIVDEIQRDNVAVLERDIEVLGNEIVIGI